MSSHQSPCRFFEEYNEPNFARSGAIANEQFELKQGPLDEDKCPFNMEPQLRKLGLQTRLENGSCLPLTSHYLTCTLGCR